MITKKTTCHQGHHLKEEPERRRNNAMKLATGNPATVKSCRIAAGMPSASTSEEGPNLLALDRRAPDRRQAEQLSLEHE
jgi:hypothetical protein